MFGEAVLDFAILDGPLDRVALGGLVGGLLNERLSSLSPVQVSVFPLRVFSPGLSKSSRGEPKLIERH
jgi:hypothetical protein